MKWIEAHIDTTTEGLEPLGDRLTAVGVDCFSIEDETDFKMFLENNRKFWDFVDEDLMKKMQGLSRVTFYLPDDADGRAMYEAVQTAIRTLPTDRPDIRFGTLAMYSEENDDCDWSNMWKQYYKPFPVGERLYVCPEWETPGEDARGRIVFVSNPGLAFGSGLHATTRLCMGALETSVQSGDRVLDMGCGSGILSVIAALLGAKEVTGVDIDSKAADTSGQNASKNGVEDRCRFMAFDLTETDAPLNRPEEGYDLIVANIVADVIIALSGKAYELLRRGGTFVTSGIIDTRLDDVLAALKTQGFGVETVLEDSGWRAVIAKKQ